MLQPSPQSPQPNVDNLPPTTPTSPASAVEESMPVMGDSADMQEGSPDITKELEAHLDTLQEQDKAFLAEHLTPEFVRAIGLINGPEVAQYLNQFADQSKVLVPVPREVAEKYLAEQGANQSASQPQSPTPSAPVGGSLMTPQAPQQATATSI